MRRAVNIPASQKMQQIRHQLQSRIVKSPVRVSVGKKFLAKLNAFVDYKNKYGTNEVKRSDKEHAALYRWITRNRFARKENQLTKEQIELLNAYDFPWEAVSSELIASNNVEKHSKTTCKTCRGKSTPHLNLDGNS